MKKLVLISLILASLPCGAAVGPRPVMVDSNGVLTTPTAPAFAAANPTLFGSNSAQAAFATAVLASNLASAAAYTSGVALAQSSFNLVASTNIVIDVSVAGGRTNYTIRATGSGGTGGPQSLGIMPDGSTNAFGTAALLNSNLVARLGLGTNTIFMQPYPGTMTWNGSMYSNGVWAVAFNGTTWAVFYDGVEQTVNASLFGVYGGVYTVSQVTNAITDASGKVMLDVGIGYVPTNMGTSYSQILWYPTVNKKLTWSGYPTISAGTVASNTIVRYLNNSTSALGEMEDIWPDGWRFDERQSATNTAIALAAFSNAIPVMTNGIAVYGSDVTFPDSNTPPRVVFAGIGTNLCCQGQSAVLGADGNFLVAFRLANKGDTGRGSIYMLRVTPYGTVLSTNVIFADAFYDSANVVLEKTSSNTLLCAFCASIATNATTIPTIAVRWLRSTDDGTTWTTNTLNTGNGTNASTGGRMAQCGNGKIVWPIYQMDAGVSNWFSYVFSSTDDGLSFGNKTLLADHNTAYPTDYDEIEPSLTALGGSNILALIRTDVVTVSSYSYDAGATWSVPGYAFLYGSAKIDCVRLNNGLLVASGRSFFNNYHMAYWTSADNGTNWTTDNRFIEARYGWADYSSAVPLDSGLVAMFSGYFLNDTYFGNGMTNPVTLTYGAYAGLTPQGNYLGLPTNLATQAQLGGYLTTNGNALTATTAGSISNQGNAATSTVAYIAGTVGVTFTNGTHLFDGTLNATNGVYFTNSVSPGTNFWILFQ
jgi:hypothetical protein